MKNSQFSSPILVRSPVYQVLGVNQALLEDNPEPLFLLYQIWATLAKRFVTSQT